MGTVMKKSVKVICVSLGCTVKRRSLWDGQ